MGGALVLLAACSAGTLDLNETGWSNGTEPVAPRFEGQHALGAASARLASEEPQQHAGRVLEVGDLDGDGDQDLVVTTVRDDDYEGGPGS